MPALLKAQNGLEIHQNKKHGARPEAPGVWASSLEIVDSRPSE
jgi:hypothetical protein